MPESEKKAPDQFSKSQRKRDMLAMQELGERLTRLSDTQLSKLPLSDSILDAINTMRSLKANEAKRRHLQYIGKLMRDEDCEAILLALKKNRL